MTIAPPPQPVRIRADTRAAVRALLADLPEFRTLDAGRRRDLAGAMVRVLEIARDLSDERDSAEQQVEFVPPPPTVQRSARALAAEDDFGGAATRELAATTRRVLDAVSFPRFVEELVNGVFKAMVGSSIKQMEAYVDLLDSVASSGEGFAARNMGAGQARRWLVEQFPDAYELRGGSDDEEGLGWEGDAETPDEDAKVTVALRPGATAPSASAIGEALGIEPSAVTPDDPERLIPVVRRALAARRQSMLSTLVMLGMNRIVVDSGRINASMRFHIDAQSAARDDRGSTFDARHTSSAGGSFGVGAWGASASMTNTIGYVKTEQTQTTEELNTELDLNSSVEINFKSDYLPLNRLASAGQVRQIREQSRNPDAPDGATASSARRAAQQADATARRTAVSGRLNLASQPPEETAAARREREQATARREAAGRSEGAPAGSRTAPASPVQPAATG